MRNLLIGTSMAALMLVVGPSLGGAQTGAPKAAETYTTPPNQMVDMQDAKIAHLKADLRLTPDQDKNWGRFETAMHELATRRADRMKQMEQAARASSTPVQPVTPTPGPAPTQGAGGNAGGAAATNTAPGAKVAPLPPIPPGRTDTAARPPAPAEAPATGFAADLRLDADVMATRADDFRKFADAAAPLFESLDDRQRHRFLTFVDYFLVDEARSDGEMPPMGMGMGDGDRGAPMPRHEGARHAYEHHEFGAPWDRPEEPGFRSYGQREYGPHDDFHGYDYDERQ